MRISITGLTEEQLHTLLESSGFAWTTVGSNVSLSAVRWVCNPTSWLISNILFMEEAHESQAAD